MTFRPQIFVQGARHVGGDTVFEYVTLVLQHVTDYAIRICPPTAGHFTFFFLFINLFLLLTLFSDLLLLFLTFLSHYFLLTLTPVFVSLPGMRLPSACLADVDWLLNLGLVHFLFFLFFLFLKLLSFLHVFLFLLFQQLALEELRVETLLVVVGWFRGGCFRRRIHTGIITLLEFLHYNFNNILI